MELLVVIVIIGILAALLLPGLSHGPQDIRFTHCVNNLKQLWGMQNIYMITFGGDRKLFPTETGGDFWLKLNKTNPPLIDSTVLDVFVCSFTGNPADGISTDYRGPASDVNKYGDDDPVGADNIGNHGQDEGGNLLRKNGDVVTVGPNDGAFLSPTLAP